MQYYKPEPVAKRSDDAWQPGSSADCMLKNIGVAGLPEELFQSGAENALYNVAALGLADFGAVVLDLIEFWRDY